MVYENRSVSLLYPLCRWFTISIGRNIPPCSLKDCVEYAAEICCRNAEVRGSKGSKVAVFMKTLRSCA